jgi:diguanylate cyclase (GGDEF)-like protein/PAS domain S-box-containing protein
MDKELRILMLEDSSVDAELEEYELRKSELVFTLKIVDTREAFLKELNECSPDLILSDYDLPTFDGLAALRIAKEKCPDVPFILVTGKLGEEFAIEKLKEGATDYVLKSNLKRLVPSVNRALEEAKQITERKRAEAETRWKTALLEAQLNATIDGILIVDEKGNKVIQNQRCIDLWKIPQHIVDNCDDKQQVEFVMNRAKDPQKFVEKVIYLYAHPNETSQEELEFKDGTILDRYSAPVIGKDGTYFGRIWIFRDVTKRRQAEKALLDNEAYLKTVMASIQAGVMIIDVEKHTIADINMAAANLIGVKREEIIGKECHQYVCPADKGKCPITDLNQIVDRSERVLINAQGEQIPILKTVVPLTINERKYLVESFIDITERKRMEEELNRLAITDNLTKAFNRTKYEEVIKREIQRAVRHSRPLSIVMFDIDHFKEVNDTYGHDVGDYVLKTLSQIVKKNIRDIDYLIRWGGEEFLLIALDTDSRGVEVMAEKIRKVIENHNFDKVNRVTVSFGVTQFKDGDTGDSFIKRADDALYKAKEKGRNRVEVTYRVSDSYIP